MSGVPLQRDRVGDYSGSNDDQTMGSETVNQDEDDVVEIRGDGKVQKKVGEMKKMDIKYMLSLLPTKLDFDNLAKRMEQMLKEDILALQHTT